MKTLPCLALILCAAGLPAARAYSIGILPGQPALFLQVGTGTVSGLYKSGGKVSSNPIVNTTVARVQSAELGIGIPQTMIPDSTVTASAYDGTAICSSPATTGQVYVAGFARTVGNSSSPATLAVSTPPNLINTASGDTIPFSRVGWLSSGVTPSGGSENDPTIPSGTFTDGGGQQTLKSIARNYWFENCLTFRYLNTELVVPGTFTGQAIFTLSTP